MAGFEDLPSGVVLGRNGRPEADSWSAWYLRALHWQVMILFFVLVALVGHYMIARYGIASKDFLVFVLVSGLVFWALILRAFFILRGFLQPRTRLIASILCSALILTLPYLYFVNSGAGFSFEGLLNAIRLPDYVFRKEPVHSVPYDPWDPTHGYVTYKLNPYAEVVLRDKDDHVISSFETHYRFNQKLPAGRYTLEMNYLGRNIQDKIIVRAGERYVVKANMFRMDTEIFGEGG